jgi:hypothetical protein
MELVSLKLSPSATPKVKAPKKCKLLSKYDNKTKLPQMKTIYHIVPHQEYFMMKDLQKIQISSTTDAQENTSHQKTVTDALSVTLILRVETLTSV